MTEPDPATQDAYREANDRLHHLSMLLAGGIAELGRGHRLGTIPRDAPGLHATRDIIDLALIARAELNTLSRILIEKGITTPEELAKIGAEEADALADARGDQFSVTVTEDGIHLDAERLRQHLAKHGRWL